MTAKQPKFVVYERVSTTMQKIDGYGMAAQQAAVQAFAAARQGRIVASYREVESGRNSARPELAKAIARCRKSGACLLVGKLDRLSRNVSFLMTLKDSGVEIAAADMPEANTLMFTVMAGVAQHEAEMISLRTKNALAAAKARGVKLGGFRAGAADLREYQAQGVQALKSKAQEAAERLRDDVEPLVRQGLSLRAIAARLTEDESLTPRNRAWGPSGVKNLIERLGLA
ncbi:MAG TPA: recombinase family protein [Rhizomicrobium sp.]|jgi:DNA invertase Pin-like site-specific DNA recombinase|nr:recombinase family protein [Rhizomicrobium sp.]